MAQSPYGAIEDTTYNIPARTQTVRVRDSSMPQGYGTRFSRTTLDGLGRPVMVESGPMSGTVETVQSVVQMEYEPCACSPLGKVKRQSMPHALTAMPVWTEYDWDPVLGRAAAVRHAGNTGTTSYTYGRDGATGFEYVKTTTPKGRWKTHIFDAAGNLVKVREPRPGGGEYETDYQYNVLNQLKQVTMPRLMPNGTTVTQIRTWNYDLVTGRLMSMTNPESGTVIYTYNPDGSLASKRDAKNQLLEYIYVAGTTYLQEVRVNGGIAYSYQYGSAPGGYGRTQSVTYLTNGGNLTESYTYHPAGAVLAKSLRVQRSFPTIDLTLTAGFNYDNEGRLFSTTYPGGDVARYEFDNLGRPSKLYYTSGGTQRLMVTDAVYGPAGELTSMNIFRSDDYQDYISETRQYNTRLQLTRLQVTTKTFLGDAPGMNLTYSFDPVQNDGKITGMTNHVTGEVVSYGYDELERLSSSVSSLQNLSFTYDGFGNRLSQTGTGPNSLLTYDGATNRINSPEYLYDANGNLTQSAGQSGTFSYDAFNRLAQAGTVEDYALYGYGPDNRRVWHRPAVGYEQFNFYFGGRLLSTHMLGQDGVGNWLFTTGDNKLFFGARRINKPDPWGYPVVPPSQDRLGSESRHYPYGEEVAPDGYTGVKFATYRRDNWMGLDYADQRYYSSQTGRFLTPDPYQASGGPAVPASWNRYSYVHDDPINYNDPSGLSECPASYQTSVTIGSTTYITTVKYICVFGYNAWESKTYSTQYVGYQQIYESGGCSTGYGLACWEEFLTLEKVIEGIHTILDIAGLVPAAGEVADLANAILYGAQLDGANAVISLAGILPGGQVGTGARAFRNGLIQRTGVTTADVVGQHAHHMLPQARRFTDRFQAAGINLQDPAWGAWWQGTDHLRNAYQYNKDWDTFFAQHPLAGAQEITDFARQLAQKYGLNWP